MAEDAAETPAEQVAPAEAPDAAAAEPPEAAPPAADAAPAAPADRFVLPTTTRASAVAATPEFESLLAQLVGLCSGEPLTAVAAVADALARQHPSQCVAVSVTAGVWRPIDRAAARAGSPRRTRCCSRRRRCVRHSVRRSIGARRRRGHANARALTLVALVTCSSPRAAAARAGRRRVDAARQGCGCGAVAATDSRRRAVDAREVV